MVQWVDGKVAVETNAAVTHSVMRGIVALLRTAARASSSVSEEAR